MTSKARARVCYLSVDGMTDPLGRSQVLPYLEGLAARGHHITLLSLEKPDRYKAGAKAVRAICDAARVEWVPLSYRSSPPILAGQWNVWRLGREALRRHRTARFDIVHARSDLASLAGARLWREGGAHFLYDMRALWPDERVDGGSWPQSNPLFRYIFRRFKRHQLEFLDEASAIVSLTSRGKKLVEEWPGRTGKGSVTVIPCCSDYGFFRPAPLALRESSRADLEIEPNERVLTYLGSVGTWYMLGEMLDFAAAHRRCHPATRLLIVTPDDPAPIFRQAAKRDLDGALIIRSASRDEVPRYLAAADIGLFFIMPTFSKQFSSPTKLGEMLASGLPVVTNDGVGDVGEILRETQAGVLIDRFEERDYLRAIGDLDRMRLSAAEIRDRSRHWFDVESGIEAYESIYSRLMIARAQR